MTKTLFEIHPAANMFPPMSDDAFAKLKEDISKNGQCEDIVIWSGQLIDGRHRLRACQELGREPQVAELDEDQDPWKYVISHNLYRRHLKQSQRAMIAAEMASMKLGSNQYRKEGGPNGPPSIEEAAKLVGTSPMSVKRAKQILDKGSAAVIESWKSGELSTSLAAKLVTEEESKAEQTKVVNKGRQAVKDYLTSHDYVEDEESPVPSKSEQTATSNLTEFKKLWKRCTKEGKAAIRIWIDENFLND